MYIYVARGIDVTGCSVPGKKVYLIGVFVM